MTPTRISELPEGLRQLAELRRSEMPILLKDEDILSRAFLFCETEEGHSFWNEVNLRNYEKVIALKVNE